LYWGQDHIPGSTMSTTDPVGSPWQDPSGPAARTEPAAAPVAAPVAAPRRRGPTWPALVATALGAALVASGATSFVSTLDDDAPASVQREAGPASSGAASDEGEDRAEAAQPVVTGTGTVPDWVALAAAVGPTVVAIDVRTASGSGAGSGVLVSDDGRIVTNHHVVGPAVDGGGTIVVTLSDGRMFGAAVVGTDPPTDLAVIELQDPPGDLGAATLGDSDAVRVGDPVAAIGNPLGLSHTVTTGIVSALDRPVTTAEASGTTQGAPVTTNAIQVDAPINPGNSGGPLFDAQGRVIGINSSIASMPGGAGGVAGSIGLGFAIPSNLVDLITTQLIEGGVAQHAYLGVTLGDSVAEVGEEVRSGAEVQTVEPGTPAETAGLRPGDVVVRVDDEPVTSAESLTGVIRQYPSGTEVTLTIARDGERVEVPATLATREDQRF
jgi:putative serine protease PepD